MKIKTFWTDCYKDDDFETVVNDFIKGKRIIQISTGDSLPTDDDYVHTLTVLYEESKHDERKVNMMKANHKTIVVEFSDKFDKEMVLDEIRAMCNKLSLEYGFHTIVNDLSDSGVTSADKITNNVKTWEQFIKLEAQHDTRTD